MNNKSFKTSFLLPIFFFTSLFLFLIFMDNEEVLQSEKKIVPPSSLEKVDLRTEIPYETLMKVAQEAKGIQRRPSSEQELKFIPLRRKSEVTLPVAYRRQDRYLIGDHVEKYTDLGTHLELKNKPSEQWKEKLGSELLRFQPNEVKIALAHEKSFIDITGHVGRYVEQVVVNFINPDGNNNAYRALADSETGQIIKVWDRTHHDNPKPFSFSQHKD